MAQVAAHSALVNERTSEARGEALRLRRLALGIKSVNELHKQARISREAITAAEAGTASEATYQRLEAWFDRFEEEVGADDPQLTFTHGIVEFEVSGDSGVRVVVRGPVADAEALERSVSRLVRRIRDEGQAETPPT